MRKKLVIYPYAFAQFINEGWYGLNRYVVGNSLIAVFLGLNIQTLFLVFGGPDNGLVKESVLTYLIPIIIWVLLCLLYNETYMSQFSFETKKIKKARIIVFIYFILSIIVLIAVNEYKSK